MIFIFGKNGIFYLYFISREFCRQICGMTRGEPSSNEANPPEDLEMGNRTPSQNSNLDLEWDHDADLYSPLHGPRPNIEVS